MINFFDIVKSLYKKTKLNFEINYDHQLCITLSKWMGRDKSNLAVIKKILPYMFYIDPKHYFYLLFFTIPQKFNIPYFKKIDKVKQKENKLLDKLQYVLGWSKKELEFQLPILEKVILNNKKYWKRELGVK